MVTTDSELVTIQEDLNEIEGAPLLCAGITTFDALKNSGAKVGDVVAIQGIGGLGYLAIQYAKNMGFKTVAISRGSDKKELAEKLGAKVFIATEEQDATKELQKLGGAKVILITAPSSKAVSELVGGLGFDGKIMIVAAMHDLIQVSPGQLMVGRQSIQGWHATGDNVKKDTLDFSTLTNVKSIVETFPLEQIDLAYEKMMTAKVHFRAVLTME